MRILYVNSFPGSLSEIGSETNQEWKLKSAAETGTHLQVDGVGHCKYIYILSCPGTLRTIQMGDIFIVSLAQHASV